MSARSTSKAKSTSNNSLRDEYQTEDLGVGVRGKYLRQFEAGTNLVLLAPDVARVFSTEREVNDALRSLIGVAERSTRPTSRRTSSAPKQSSSKK